MGKPAQGLGAWPASGRAGDQSYGSSPSCLGSWGSSPIACNVSKTVTVRVYRGGEPSWRDKFSKERDRAGMYEVFNKKASDLTAQATSSPRKRLTVLAAHLVKACC